MSRLSRYRWGLSSVVVSFQSWLPTELLFTTFQALMALTNFGVYKELLVLLTTDTHNFEFLRNGSG